MKILILNGSPKGKYSITLQTSLYLAKHYSNHQWTFYNVSQKIKSLEKDLHEVLALFAKTDLIIFSYPIYTFLAPSQLHLFISLLKENKIDLSNKYATQITTSKHFYDITAHQYLKDNCLDLGFNYLNGFSADMDDLLTEKGQDEAIKFFAHLEWLINNKTYEKQSTKYFTPLLDTISNNQVQHSNNFQTVIITDYKNASDKLIQMINYFQDHFPYTTKIIDLSTFPFKGGCLGCLNCATNGKCIYTDHFDEYLRNEIQTNNAFIYAFTIKDHSMGPIFKMFDDRQFCNGHRTVTMGIPVGYIIDGYYYHEDNLQMIIKARSSVGGNYLAGVACNQNDPQYELDTLINNLDYSLVNNYHEPQNFLGVGGMKIFRDLIYQMRGMMRADHKFFKKNHQYDFPQKKKGLSLKMYLVGFIFASPKIKNKIAHKINEGMIAPYQKIIKEKEMNNDKY